MESIINRITRISNMEEKLDSAVSAIQQLDKAIEYYSAQLGNITELAAYLTSEDWKEDFAADEAGKLPRDLERGVLSEDGIYDMLQDNRQLEVRTAELLAEIVRRGRI